MATLGAAVRNGISAPAPERVLEHAPPGGGVHLPKLVLIGVALIGVATLGLLQVLQTSQVATAGFELRTLHATRAGLESQNRLLEAEIASQSQLERIHEEAVTRLGMIEPGRTLRVSVDQPAPSTVPLPRRYVDAAPVIEEEPAAWWEPLLERIPGFD